MKIRKAETSDIKTVAEVVRGLSHYYLDGGATELPEWFNSTLTDSAFADRFNDNDYFNFVADVGGVVAGYISVKPGFHLYHLFVASGFHNNGIAKCLWQHCVSHLQIQKCTVRSSLFAVPVYSKFGFRASGGIAYKEGIGFQAMVYSSS